MFEGWNGAREDDDDERSDSDDCIDCAP